MTRATLMKEKNLTEAGLQVQRFSHGRKHGDTHRDMALEKEPRVLHLNQQAAGRAKRCWT